eukprot:COSAG05_NODE_12375_length_470_cov_1.250674_1_plen_68_part_01
MYLEPFTHKRAISTSIYRGWGAKGHNTRTDNMKRMFGRPTKAGVGAGGGGQRGGAGAGTAQPLPQKGS